MNLDLLKFMFIMEELKKQYDPVGYSFWFLHYDKYGDEGKVDGDGDLLRPTCDLHLAGRLSFAWIWARSVAASTIFYL